jgi:hypothetical protein
VAKNIVRTARSPLWHKAKSLQQKQVFKAPAQAAEASRSCCCCRYGSSPFTNNPWLAERRANRLDSCGVGPTFSAMSVTRELRRRLQSDRSLPRFEPCLPRPVQHPPAGPGWIHEIKHDGFRILAHRQGRSVRLLTRNGNDLGDRFPLAAAAIEALPVRSCVVDGEAIVCDDGGLAVFDLIRGHATNAGAVLPAGDAEELARERAGATLCARTSGCWSAGRRIAHKSTTALLLKKARVCRPRVLPQTDSEKRVER